MSQQIKVKLTETAYSIIIGSDSLDKLIKHINSLQVDKCLIVVDKNVFKYHSLLIKKTFTSLNCKTYNYIYTANEKSKSLSEVQKIEKFLTENYFTRNSVIVAIGGGITGDVCGFAANIFMRGIKIIQIPTTLLAMVDSSVGGKTGVNFDNKKNLLGTFYQPNSVYIYPDFLKTLPKRELHSGAGEIFKYAFLADASNYKKLKNDLRKLFLDRDVILDRTISSCLKIKSNIVMQDEKEFTGLRKILNFGHTFAHAFETTSNYKIKHGEAVIGGIYCALFISESMGYIKKYILNDFISDFSFIKPNKNLLNLNNLQVFKSMISDKKNKSGNIRIVLLDAIGEIVVDVPVTKASIFEAIEMMKMFIKNKNRFKRGKLSSFEGET